MAKAHCVVITAQVDRKLKGSWSYSRQILNFIDDEQIIKILDLGVAGVDH